MNDEQNKESSFVEHLAELRSRLVKSIIYLFIFFIVCYFFSENIYSFLVAPYADAVKNDDKDYIVTLLSDNQFSTNDDMLNAFLYRIKALYLYSEDIDNCARYYKKAINLVPSYDLKIVWGTDLIDLYLEDANYDEADNMLQLLKDLIGDEDNLSLSEKNNLNFIESKISQLIN